MPLTARVIDSVHGRAASGVPVLLEQRQHTNWSMVAAATTDDAGALPDWSKASMDRGLYRLTIVPDAYFAGLGSTTFCRELSVVFEFGDVAETGSLDVVIAPHAFALFRTR